MHNGYQRVGADEDVSIIIAPSADYTSRAWLASAAIEARAPTAVTMAGYHGTFQELVRDDGLRREVWIIDIEGRSVTIEFELQSSSEAGGVAEAREIIRSIEIEPRPGDLGFWLLLTLPSGWDSG